MPTVENNNKSLKDRLAENNASVYSNVLINVPKEADKGAAFQVGDSFRTPTYVAGATDTYGKPINIEKGTMDYIAAFAKDSVQKIQEVSKVLDPNNERGLVQKDTNRDTGEYRGYSSNKLAGSVTVQGADGENYRLSVQQKKIADELRPYRPSAGDKELYGDIGMPKPSQVQVFGTEISVAKQDKNTQEYSQEMGKIMLWGQREANGRLVSSESIKEGAVVKNYFSLAKDQDIKAFRLIGALVKDGFSYTAEQREAEKANPEMVNNPKNMSFRILDKDVAQNIKQSFVKTAEEVTKGTSRSMDSTDMKTGEVNGKTLFVSAVLDTASNSVEGRKTTAILTPAVWTGDKHEIDYSKHIAKVDPQYGQKNIAELGSNLNKAVSDYNKDKGSVDRGDGQAKNVEKVVSKTAKKGKDIDY